MRRRSLVLLVLVAAVASPAALADTLTSAGSASFAAGRGTVLSLGPHGSFRGTVEVRRTGTALAVVNHLDLEEYVLGVREVPGMWPMEALKAQAVAARTYALWEKQQGRHAPNGFDICPTVSCQVFQGAWSDEGEPGARWAEAVRATEGQVLMHDGAPALTRYHSSSGGRTLPNHVVYGGAPRPYLMGTDDPFDSVSPMHRWSADFPHAILQELIRPELGPDVVMAAVRVDGRTLVVELGESGERAFDTMTLRTILNDRAPRMFGDRYPAVRADGQRMPSTLPSPRFDVEAYEGGIRFNGRGWGHGVGMSQWGAMGRASRGHSHAQILSAYYGGLTPTAWTGDRSMRVGVVPQTSEVRVDAASPAAVSGAAGPMWPPTAGSWTVRPGPDATITVEGPPLPPPPTPEPSPAPVLEVGTMNLAAPLPASPADGRAHLPTVAIAVLMLALACTLLPLGALVPRSVPEGILLGEGSSKV